MEGENFSNKEIIEGIINNDYKVLKFIYSTLKPKIVSSIVKNGGYRYDADDIFQIALIDIKLKLEKGKIKINNFSDYLFNTAKFIWYKEIKNKSQYEDTVYKYFNEKDVVEAGITEFAPQPALAKILRCFNLLSKECQKIFIMRSKGYPYTRIAEKLNVNSNYVRLKRKRCYTTLLTEYKKTLKNETRKQ